MANDLNCCNFIGRLGKDPETRYLASGDAVCNFSIAVGWKTKEKEGAEWVPITTYGKLAEICAKYLTKGSQVFVSGRFKTRKWTDKNGQDRYSTDITADTMQMLGGKSGERSESRQEQESPNAGGGMGTDEFSDDIPFAPIRNGYLL